jgi:hypothetical protein
MNNNKQQGLFFLGFFVAVGLALAGYFVGQTLYNAKRLKRKAWQKDE